MVSGDAAGVETALKVSDHDGLPKVGVGHKKSVSRARSTSQEYVIRVRRYTELADISFVVPVFSLIFLFNSAV